MRSISDICQEQPKMYFAYPSPMQAMQEILA